MMRLEDEFPSGSLSEVFLWLFLRRSLDVSIFKCHLERRLVAHFWAFHMIPRC